ncbi:M14 family metallopeptidase [Bacteroidota bacterium]
MKSYFIRNKIIVLSFLLGQTVAGISQPDLRYNENKTPTWEEVIDLYRDLDKRYSNASLLEAGTTDVGKPLHLFVISDDASLRPEEIHKVGKRIIMINNGIHPGESNGIDASIEFAYEILSGKHAYSANLKNTVILIIPVFNVGGALNRSPYHRANQNGPEEHGFRGNARNLDLNRDFVKMDSRNARSIAKIIHKWDPDIFIDTHSTNGADYPYTVTIIPSHHQQLAPSQSAFMKDVMLPELFLRMNESPDKMSQYVNIFRGSPEEGFRGFFEYPRYLAGYTSTFNILSFTIETHMLKPYADRVQSTKQLLGEMLKFTSEHADEIASNKKAAIESVINQNIHVLQWKSDTSRYDMIDFTGYKAKYKPSELTGQQMLYYDREDIWKAKIPFYDYFQPAIEVEAPEYYIVPGAWNDVIERLKCSNIQMHTLTNDTTLNAQAYFIDAFESGRQPYNGHYWHYNTSVHAENVDIQLYSGDIIIPVKQRGAPYIVHTLEPRGYDSFFSWNFFDACLSRKEYFSPYLFEETAIHFLEQNPEIKKEFESLKEQDPDFSNNARSQLYWIYSRSPWSEPTYQRYPVYRYNGSIDALIE